MINSLMPSGTVSKKWLFVSTVRDKNLKFLYSFEKCLVSFWLGFLDKHFAGYHSFLDIKGKCNGLGQAKKKPDFLY